MGLSPPLRNFVTPERSPLTLRVKERRGRASRLDEAENGQDEILISPSETKRFAGHAVSHWNHYDRRIRHFAGLFVFKGLAPFSFRRFHGLFIFNVLAPIFLSPRNSPRPRKPGADVGRRSAKRLWLEGKARISLQQK
ncbi:MAG TPA: hypothetical protein VN637_13250 [Roseiarcus sp.]|nr:hypothetical protein [Roseiarcus sp.]